MNEEVEGRLPPSEGSRREVVIYAKDGWNSSSSFYRLFQYVPAIESTLGVGVKVRVLASDRLQQLRYSIAGSNCSRFRRISVKTAYTACLAERFLRYSFVDAIRQPSVLIVSRSLLPRICFGPWAWLLRTLVRRSGSLFWDFDDDIVSSGEISNREWLIYSQNARRIVITHQGLAKVLTTDAMACTDILPTTDMALGRCFGERATESKTADVASVVRLIWVGSSSGLGDLVAASGALDCAAKSIREKQGQRLRLTVVCNRRPELQLRHMEYSYVKWSRDAALSELREAHIGLMPLVDNKFNRGKGSFKVVQCLGASLPVIGSAVGFNQEVIRPGVNGFLIHEGTAREWELAIQGCTATPEQWNGFSNRALVDWENRFNPMASLRYWTEAVAKG